MAGVFDRNESNGYTIDKNCMRLRVYGSRLNRNYTIANSQRHSASYQHLYTIWFGLAHIVLAQLLFSLCMCAYLFGILIISNHVGMKFVCVWRIGRYSTLYVAVFCKQNRRFLLVKITEAIYGMCWTIRNVLEPLFIYTIKMIEPW